MITLILYDSSIITLNLSQSTTSFFISFINFNDVQINIIITSYIAIQINQFVNKILTNITSSLHLHILDLKNTVIIAVINKAVL